MEMTAAVAHEFFMCHAFKKSQKKKNLKEFRENQREMICVCWIWFNYRRFL